MYTMSVLEFSTWLADNGKSTKHKGTLDGNYLHFSEKHNKITIFEKTDDSSFEPVHSRDFENHTTAQRAYTELCRGRKEAFVNNNIDLECQLNEPIV